MANSRRVLVHLIVASVLVCEQVFCKPQQPLSQPSSSISASPKSSSDYSNESDSPTNPGLNVGKTKGFELKHGYSFNLANSPDGSPFSSGWAYLGGRAGAGPTYYTDDSGFLPAELWSGRAIQAAEGSLYVASAALALASLWYTFSPMFAQRKAAKTKPTAPTTEAAKNETEAAKNETEASKDKEEDKTTDSAKKSRRMRRSVGQVVSAESDVDLTRLTSIVLNAIASGECMQKTICQLGTQVGTSPKGRLAFSLVDSLLPTSVHANQYFVTMKKALGGDSNCNQFNCHYSTNINY